MGAETGTTSKRGRGANTKLPLPPLKYGSERARAARYLTTWMRAFQQTYFPQHPMDRAINLIYVALPVMIAHVERNPIGAAALARRLGITRTTALRRLEPRVASQ